MNSCTNALTALSEVLTKGKDPDSVIVAEILIILAGMDTSELTRTLAMLELA